MKKQFLIITLLTITLSIFSQKDSLKVNNSYWEDQLYINITYNSLYNQPDGIASSEFSSGIGFGYIKDIPLNKNNTFAFGIGIGYNYDLYTHSLVITDSGFSTDIVASLNKLKTHNIEFPIQIRWRTSDAVTYSFWRIYAGLRLSYNISNKFSYTASNQDYTFKNIDTYNKLQTGVELSIGYGAFNLYSYYGLSPIYKNALYNNESVSTTIFKVGLIFYLL